MQTFGIPKRTDGALEAAAGTGPCARSTSAASASRTGTAGRAARASSATSRAPGLTGVAAERVNRSGKPLGATVAFAWGHDRDVRRATATAGSACSIDERELDQVCNNVIVANCRFYASGMKIMPMAEPDDGLLDVLVWGDVGKADLARNLHRLYRGTHIEPPQGRHQPRRAGGRRARGAAADRGRRRDAGRHPGDVRGRPGGDPAARAGLRRWASAAWASRGRARPGGLLSGRRLARSLSAASIRSSDACRRATSSRVASCSCDSAACWARWRTAVARSLVAVTTGALDTPAARGARCPRWRL